MKKLKREINIISFILVVLILFLLPLNSFALSDSKQGSEQTIFPKERITNDRISELSTFSEGKSIDNSKLLESMYKKNVARNIKNRNY